MKLARISARLCAAAIMIVASTASAQDAPESLKVFFESGSASVAGDGGATLDQAARLFREGDPIVMIVAGGADTVGAADRNLELSVERAEAVVRGLSERGIPVARLQLIGRGTSELAVETPEGVAEPQNRVVEITWR